MDIIFENGNYHTLSADEMKILRLALKGFNWCDVICSEEREKELNNTYVNLLNLFKGC